MKPNKILLLFLASFLTGCAGTNGLKKSFRDKESTLGYLHDGGKALSGKVSVTSYRIVPTLPDENEVVRRKTVVVPLLFYNYWKHDFRVDLGRAGSDAPPLHFGKTSLALDLKKSGAQVTDDGGDIKVSVRIRSLRSGADYYKSGFIIFALVAYSVHMSQGARGIESSLEADLFIERGGKVDSIRYAHLETAHIPSRTPRSDLQQVILNAMVETLSLCFKDLNATLIAEVKKRGG